MSEHDLEKLLGGFAADTLTAEERNLLYTAGLQDQQLFNALADEQVLKELLSDPDIRRRLLQALQKTNTSGVGGSLSWLDWFRRPTGLAFAGGLSAAALAVVLGVRIYQDSLRQSAQSVATEEVTPATPQAARDRSAPPLLKNEQGEVRREARAPVAAPGKSADEMTSSADQKLAASSASPSSAPKAKQMQAPVGGRIAGTVMPALSARALFYEEKPGRADIRSMAKEQEQALKPLAESAPQANRPERPLEGLSQLGKAAGTAAQPRPLGLRYSLVVRQTDGQEREVDAATASKSILPIFLTVEANQDAYLQVWETAGSSTPQLLWPKKETGQIFLKMTAGQREQIPLQMENEPITLTARLSRVPPGPTMKHESAMYDRLSPNQLQESITESNRTGSQERATYVINQDPITTAQITVEMILGR